MLSAFKLIVSRSMLRSNNLGISPPPGEEPDEWVNSSNSLRKMLSKQLIAADPVVQDSKWPATISCAGPASLSWRNRPCPAPLLPIGLCPKKHMLLLLEFVHRRATSLPFKTSSKFYIKSEIFHGVVELITLTSLSVSSWLSATCRTWLSPLTGLKMTVAINCCFIVSFMFLITLVMQ